MLEALPAQRLLLQLEPAREVSQQAAPRARPAVRLEQRLQGVLLQLQALPLEDVLRASSQPPNLGAPRPEPHWRPAEYPESVRSAGHLLGYPAGDAGLAAAPDAAESLAPHLRAAIHSPG